MLGDLVIRWSDMSVSNAASESLLGVSPQPLGISELPPSEFMQVVDSTWLVLNVLSNGRSSTSSQAIGVTKIAKSVIAPLAEHNVSVLMLSTYQTDFILVSPAPSPHGHPL